MANLQRLWRFALGASCAIVFLGVGLANAAELVMFESPGCPWCARWRAEVGPAYSHSEEGRKAPLQQVDLNSRPGFRLLSPVVVSPTFVLVENGQEVGRIVGYPGADFFWGLLERLIEKLPPKKSEGRNIKPFNLAQSETTAQ